MKGELWQRAKQIFLDASELPQDERESFLKAACGDDADLRARVDALLDSEQQADQFLFTEQEEGVAAGLKASTGTDRPGEGPGTRIGPYKLLQRIGEGGFGVVYLAEQTEPVVRTVALKIIKLGMDTKQVIARFQAERQALAMMDHPNIARVLDAGATDTGRPYFVMELVKGVPITGYCDKRNMSFRDRLKLFVQVCGAIQHAHQKGIIHRDIKPSNVLVTHVDDRPVPKVIDFGIAKAIEQRLTEATMFTELGQFIGTPAYMSPEQADPIGVDIDTRSDIYSLGVLLYELLTGVTPFDNKTLRAAALDEIKRIIREEEPSKPSTRLSHLEGELEAVAGKRSIEPKKLGALLRGDLDWIIMKALEKDRTRRYETANGFARDIERYLNDEPVAAGPPSAAYRMRKFVRRNRTGVLAGTVVAAALVVATVVSIGFALGEAEQREIADAEAKRADEEAQKAVREKEIAQAVNDFLTDDLLAAVAPSTEQGKGKDVLMRDVLDAAAERIEEESVAGGRFQGKPLVEASIRATLGWTYRLLGEYAPAELHLERARMLRRRELGEEHPGTLESMNDLAVLYHDQGHYDEAESLQVKTLEIRKRIRGEEHPRTLGSMNNLAILYWRQGRYDEAEPLYVKTLEIRNRVLGEEHPRTLGSMNNLALLYKAQDRYDEAELLYVKTLETRKRVLSEEHPETLSSMHNLALLYHRQGRYDEAEPLYLKTLEIKRRVLGEEHPSTLISMGSLANVYTKQERYDEAEPLHVETLEIQKRLLGEEHPSTLASITNLGFVYMYMKRFDDARAMFETSLPIKRRVLRMRHPWTRYALQGLAHAYDGLDRADDALPLWRELQEFLLAQAEDPDASARTLKDAAWDLLTNEHAELRNPARALPLAQRAADKAAGVDPAILDTLALAQHLTGNTPAAIETEKKALSLLPPDSPGRDEYEAALARFEAALQEPDTAEEPGGG